MSLLISVIIATYKRPQLLTLCLDCLANQSFNKDEFEVIVVSDGKDEATETAVLQWKANNKINICYSSLNVKSGPAAARNAGWNLAKSSLIAFTDDDCLPEKNWLTAFYNAFKTGLNFALSGKTIVPTGDKPTDYEKNISGLATADFITANCCCPKALLATVGGFDERFTMAWREDSDLEFRFITKGIKIIRNDDAIVVHPVRKAHWGISIKDQKKTLYNALLYKNFPVLYRQTIQPAPPYNYYIIILSLIAMLVGIIVQSVALTLTGVLVWLALTMLFISRRLNGTSKSASHIAEMILTSAVIPFLSIYWQWYGCIKYKTILV